MDTRQLDAEIAEKIFGWRYDPGLPPDEQGNIQTAFLYPPEWNDELKAWPSTCGRQQQGPYDLVPHYSESIEAAWLVVEHLLDTKEYRLQLLLRLAGQEENWYAQFWGPSGPAGDEVIGATSPHAICLAALQAVRREQG